MHIILLIHIKKQPAVDFSLSNVHIGYFNKNEIDLIRNSSYIKNASFKNRYISNMDYLV